MLLELQKYLILATSRLGVGANLSNSFAQHTRVDFEYTCYSSLGLYRVVAQELDSISESILLVICSGHGGGAVTIAPGASSS